MSALECLYCVSNYQIKHSAPSLRSFQAEKYFQRKDDLVLLAWKLRICYNSTWKVLLYDLFMHYWFNTAYRKEPKFLQWRLKPPDQAPVPSLPCALLLELGSGMHCAGTWWSPDLGSRPVLQLSILSLPQRSVHRRPSPRSAQWWIQPAVALAACVPHVVFNFIWGLLILPTKMATSPREKILSSQSPWAMLCAVLHRDSAVV